MKTDLQNKTPEFWYLLLVAVGYVVACSFAIPLGMEEKSRYFAVPFRIFMAVFSIFIIYRNFNWHKLKSITIISFLAFWLFYFIKTIISYNIHHYEPKVLDYWNEIYARIGLIIILPSVALMLINYSSLNLKTLSRYVFYVFLGMLCLNLVYGFFHSTIFLDLPAIFSIYYISYGHLGTSLALLSLFFLLFEKGNNKFLYSFGFFVGTFTLFVATARSPFLALTVVSFYMLVVRRNLKLIIAFFVLLIALVFYIWWYVQNGYSYFGFIVRTYAWLFEGDNSLRTPLFEKSITLFKESPIVGSRILYEDGSYPHNIFLELLMVTGIIGFILHFVKFLPVLKTWKLYTMKGHNIYHIFFFVLFLQYFVLVITSYNLHSVPEFVHFSSIVIGISLNYIYEKTKSDDGSRNPSGNY